MINLSCYFISCVIRWKASYVSHPIFRFFTAFLYLLMAFQVLPMAFQVLPMAFQVLPMAFLVLPKASALCVKTDCILAMSSCEEQPTTSSKCCHLCYRAEPGALPQDLPSHSCSRPQRYLDTRPTISFFLSSTGTSPVRLHTPPLLAFHCHHSWCPLLCGVARYSSSRRCSTWPLSVLSLRRLPIQLSTFI